MKKHIFVFAIALFVPLAAGAQEMMDSNSAQTGPEMMQYVEDQALQNNTELHEEMEDLMVKMMAGTLTEAEAGRLAQLMDQYPGPMGLMMNRYNAIGNYRGGYGSMMNGFGWGMTNGGGSIFVLLFAATWIVWLAVGGLAIVWLWKQIQKK